MEQEFDGKRKFTSAIDNCILLPKQVLSYINSASAVELRVIIYLCANSCGFDNDEVCNELKIKREEFEAALSYWRGAKLIALDGEQLETPKKVSTTKVNTIQTYEPDLLAKKVNEDNKFKLLGNYVAERFEKAALNKNEINSLFYLYDYIGISVELLYGIVEYCVENDRKAMNYLVKTAISMFEDQGIDTYEKLENYMAVRRSLNDNVTKFRKLAGIADRGLSSKEKTTFSTWFEERQYQFEMVELAYDITVDKLQKYNMNYINAILERWYSEGVTTYQQAKTDVESYKEKHKHFENNTFDFDDFFNSAVVKF
ncbi:MAG: hypothetical protein A2Y17_07820 [Clostridiales bacterium GWF2_38_85]|nr:MAG: hypothetical protein A2Y17_07820 [Clostridiales bacterium GWF2_38_85]HBL84217.1 hypothetical protein [Clostridiales bacterium]